MPTRPVTWEIDVVPGAPAAGPKTELPAKEIPSIADLRGSLVGGRFEMLKIGAFAAFLFSFVAVAVHGSHVTGADNQFAAATGAAIDGLAGSISSESGSLAASVHGKTVALASSAMQSASSAVNHVSGAFETDSSQTGASEAPAPQRLAHNHHHANRAVTDATGVEAPVSVDKVAHRAHHRHHETQVAMAETPASEIPIEWSGNVLDLPDYLTAEGSRAVQGGKSLLHASVQSGFSSMRSGGQSVMSSLGDNFFASLFNRDNVIAAGAALLLYTIFVLVLVQMKGSLRAAYSRPA